MRKVDKLLGPGGPLARTMAGYEPRPSQLAMAEAVEQCLADEHILICEAGTGTGKTLAYLVPALTSGKKVVVSTATRALQDQIFEHDLPLIEQTLGLPVHAALMKGLGNYVCRRRYREFIASELADQEAFYGMVPKLREWVARTQSGDIAEFADVAEGDPLLGAVVASADTRLGSACPHFEECFVTQMRARAERARIVVVNHHLFFADLALRGPHPGKVIPDYDVVIFDEAHQLEDVATQFFGTRLTSAAIARLLTEVERHLAAVPELDSRAHEARLAVFEQARVRLDELRQNLAQSADGAQGRLPIDRQAWIGSLREAWFRMDHSLELIELEARTGAGRIVAAPRRDGRVSTETLELDARRTKQCRDRLADLVEGGGDRVSWLELGPRSFGLSASPIDLARRFRESIFQRVPAVVLTSATLATRRAMGGGDSAQGAARTESGSPFGFFRSRLGLDEVEQKVVELVVDSPFDYSSRAIFYTPTDLPVPRSSEYLDAAAARIVELVEIADGGAFVLTTSLRAMSAFAASLREACSDREVLLQGEGPKPQLLNRFRETRRAVLVATLGFWEGVDVPGEALRLVILDKIPFAVPTDPIVQARARELERQGHNPFMELFLPAAAITLKQGFGRLIRKRDDYGVVALLDPRIGHKSYGHRLAQTLPAARRSSELRDVEELFRRMRS